MAVLVIDKLQPKNEAFSGLVDADQVDVAGTYSNIDGTPGDLETTISGIDTALESAGTNDHGALSGLSDDDHEQYALADGSRDFSGSVTVSGVSHTYLDVSSATPGSSAYLTLGANSSSNRNAYIDLISDDTYAWGARLIRDAGVNGNSSFRTRGTGTFSIGTQDAGALSLVTNNTERLSISSGGIHSLPQTSRAGAYLTSSQEIPNSSWTTIEWDTEAYDTRSEYNTGTGVFSPNEAGVYLITWNIEMDSVEWNPSENVNTRVKMTTGGSSSYRYGLRWECSTTDTRYVSVNGAVQVYLTSSTTAEIQVFQNCGAALDTYNSYVYQHAEFHKLS